MTSATAPCPPPPAEPRVTTERPGIGWHRLPVVDIRAGDRVVTLDGRQVVASAPAIVHEHSLVVLVPVEGSTFDAEFVVGRLTWALARKCPGCGARMVHAHDQGDAEAAQTCESIRDERDAMHRGDW